MRTQVKLNFRKQLGPLIYPDVANYGTSGEFFFVEVHDLSWKPYVDHYPIRDIVSFRVTCHEDEDGA